MKNMIHKANVLKNNYQPGEFLPIYVDGQLANKRDFVAYKLRCVLVKRSLI